MASYARVTLIGNVGRDPELKDFGQNKVAEFSLAVSGKTTGKNAGEWTNWYRVSCWGKQAEIAMQYVKKGTPIFVEGRLQLREYTKADGTPGFSLEVGNAEFQLLGSREGGEGGGDSGNYQSRQGGNSGGSSYGGGGNSGGGGGYQQRQPSAAQPTQMPEPIGPSDDDLPF